MKRGIVFYAFIFLLGTNVLAQNTFPSYSEITKKFFSAYSIDIRPKKTTLQEEVVFHKKPDGWHVVIRDVYDEDNPVLYDGLFWNEPSNEYKTLSLRKVTGIIDANKLSSIYLSQYDHKYFRIYPFYGYKGWDKDVIAFLENVENLDDSTTYALGRAYSSYASNLLHNNSGYQLKAESFNFNSIQDNLTEEQLATYRKYRHKAIENFKKVAKINPDFKTIVGSISVKLWNEHLTSFLDLRQYKNETEAQKEIKEELYDANVIAVAKNYLSDCEQNAILLTNGDSDTYPLLYAQAKLNIRPDVLVVNLSLLNTRRYINHLRSPVLEAQAIPMSLTNEVFEEEKFTYVVLDTLLSTYKPMRLVIKEIPKSIDPSRWYTVKLSTNKFTIPTDQDTLFIKVNDQYILRSTIVLFDVLGQSNLNRPIHFSATMNPETYLPYQNYLYQTGLIYDLRASKKTASNNVTGQVDVEAMYANLMESYDWGNPKTAPGEAANFYSAYRFEFNQLAEIFIQQNKLDTAKKLLNKSLNLMPNRAMPFDGYSLKTAELFYKTGDEKAASSIFKKVNQNFKKGLTSYDPLRYIDYMISRADEEEEKELIDYLQKVKKKL